jgi:alpha-D-xyloside xylohydrolase
MKFTDGNWMMRPGVQAAYPAEVYEVEEIAGGVRVIAPTRRIQHRGDTLGGPILTIDLSSPMPDVVGIKVSRFTGAEDRGPHFEISPDSNHLPKITIDDAAILVESGRVTARLDRAGAWQISFSAEGRQFAEVPARGMAHMETDEGIFTHSQLALGAGELVYGLGERFTAFVKNGQVVDIWNKDGGTSSEQAYKSIPFYLTNRGYGVFVREPGPVSFEVASERLSRVQFSVPGESLEFFIIYGPTPKEILQKYTALTGRSALPPAWTFGLWLTTSFTTNYDETTVTEFIEGMAERNLPLHVFHFDCFWMRDFHWCDFEWDSRVFPDPVGMLKRLKAKGLKICVWINPYIAQRSKLFEEGRANGYLIKKTNGDVWQTDQWQPGMGIVDFTNPDAVKWYQSKLKMLLDQGVDSFKTDFGERIPTDVVYHDGSDPVGMHNYYPYLYNRAVFELLESERGTGEACLFARSATVGGQKFPVHWGGDCDSLFESMAESLRGGLSLGMSGFGFWSHDIGGFEGLPNASLYKRWIAFGLLSSHSRLHGSSSYRVPWLIDEESCEVLRFFTNLKCRLMPYLFAIAVDAHQTGVPVMRSMLLEFPDDPACEYLDRQYMLGESLLVAPVFSADNFVDYYLPSGHWTHFLTGEVREGGKWFRESHDFMSIPLWVRPGSAIPVGKNDARPDYVYSDGLEVRLYEFDDGQSIRNSIPNLKGEPALNYIAGRTGNTVLVEVDQEIEWTSKCADANLSDTSTNRRHEYHLEPNL